MINDNNELIGFMIADINTDEYALIEDNYDQASDVETSLNTTVEFGADANSKVIGIRLKFVFGRGNEPFLIISSTLSFLIEESSWENILTESKEELIIPENFASHMGLIAIGTIRGILHEKTSKSKTKGFILPPIDLTKILVEDIRVKIKV